MKIFLITSLASIFVLTLFSDKMSFDDYAESFPLVRIEGKDFVYTLAAYEVAGISEESLYQYVILVRYYEESVEVKFLNAEKFNRGEMGVLHGFREVVVLLDRDSKQMLDIKVD